WHDKVYVFASMCLLGDQPEGDSHVMHAPTSERFPRSHSTGPFALRTVGTDHHLRVNGRVISLSLSAIRMPLSMSHERANATPNRLFSSRSRRLVLHGECLREPTLRQRANSTRHIR